MASVNRTHPALWGNLMSVLSAGAGNFESGTLKAMILGSGTTADTEWQNFSTLDGYTALDEFTSTGPVYYRKTLASITSSSAGSQTFLDFANPVWTSLPVGLTTPEHILLYFELDGAAADPALTNRVPVACGDGSFTPDGTNFEAVVPLNGLFYVETDP